MPECAEGELDSRGRRGILSDSLEGFGQGVNLAGDFFGGEPLSPVYGSMGSFQS